MSWAKTMMEEAENHESRQNSTPEARYAYYRRCQVFRRNGEQCKAPAEKGAHICYAHAGQQAMEERRKRERRAVLEEVVRQMRERGKPQFGMADVFMDFNGIQMALAVMAQALIDGKIDCKTAGRLALDVQMMAKLLRLYHRGHGGARRGKPSTTKDTKEHKGLFTAETRRSGETKNLPQIVADGRGLDRSQEIVEIRVAAMLLAAA